MKKFIRYLYEYQNGKRIRNVGFVRTEESDDSAVIQIYGQGFPVSDGQTLEIFLFYLMGNQTVGIYMGEIPGTRSAFGYRLAYSTEDAGGIDFFNKIEGMILRKKRNEEEEWYAAVWNERRVDVENMIRREEILRRETKEETKQSEKEELPEDVELSKKEDIPENPESSGEKVPADTEAPEEEELTENVEQSEPVEKLEDDRESLTEEVTEKEEGYREQIFKISRQDLAQLPRREWRLANNHFLLHGYHNYHHLVSFRKDGRCWLGVPGIYHPREECAAGAFGFRQFMKPEKGEMEWTEGERSQSEDFGYWCREISNVIKKTRREEDEETAH